MKVCAGQCKQMCCVHLCWADCVAAVVMYPHSGASGGGGLSGERGVHSKQREHSVRGWPCAEARGGEEGTLSQSPRQRSVIQHGSLNKPLSPPLSSGQNGGNLLLFLKIYVHECFVCRRVCVSCGRLVPMEVRRWC